MKKLISAVLLLVVFVFAGTAMAADGAMLYAAKCQMCHGAGGVGGAMGPVLVGNDIVKGEAGALKELISKGVARDKQKFPNFPMGMPAIILTDAELDAVVEYLKGL